MDASATVRTIWSRQFRLWLAAASAILAARLLVSTDLARAYPYAAMLLLLWVAVDTLTLSLIARTPSKRPAARAVVGSLAGGVLVAVLSATPEMRAELFERPILAGATGLLVACHVLIGAVCAGQRLVRSEGSVGDRVTAALVELLPEPLVRLARAELQLVSLALLRWNAAPDIPPEAQAHSCHRVLAPMLGVLVFLSAVEIGTVHIFVAHWHPKLALALSAISLWSLVYLVGLLKSLRLRPVLITQNGVQVRTGILIDAFVPFANIAEVRTDFSAADIKRVGTLDAGLLVWPNILILLNEPIMRNRPFRSPRRIDAVAFKLDKPAPFLRSLNDIGVGQ